MWSEVKTRVFREKESVKKAREGKQVRIRLEFNEYSSYLHLRVSWEACTKYIPKEILIQWI